MIEYYYMKKLSNQEEREKRKNNAFIEKFAYILAFVMLLFVGLTLFIPRQEKYEFNYEKVSLNADEGINQDEEKTSVREGVSLDNEVNSRIDETDGRINQGGGLSLEQKQYMADIKRRKMEDKLRKQMAIAHNPRKLAHTLYKENAPSIAKYTKTEIKGGIEYNESPLAGGDGGSGGDSYGLYASNCTREEMEYVLNLYTSANARHPLILPFRRNNPMQGMSPEIIYATLPNNKWKNLESDLEAAFSSIFSQIFQDDSNQDKTKVGAMITTPCSDAAYVSEAFFVSNSLPKKINASSAKSYCASVNGRLPDILEIISILKHKKLPQGYYITNSQRMNVNPNGTKALVNDYMVMQYQNGNVYFTSTSKLPGNQQVYGECVLR